MARTSKRQDARERARAARARIDADRARRDRQIEDAAASFFEAADARDALVAQIAAVERDMAAAVDDLAKLDEPTTRIADLLGIDAKEVRRLRATAQPVGVVASATAMPEPDPDSLPSPPAVAGDDMPSSDDTSLELARTDEPVSAYAGG